MNSTLKCHLSEKNMKHTTCLVVDDHLLFTKGLEAYILEVDPTIQCFYAKDGLEAIAMLNQMVFDFVFVDVHLGDVSGVEVIKTIQATSAAAFCIAMSGDDNVFLARAMVKAGARSFILKSMGALELRRAIEKVLKKEPYVPEWLLNAPPSLEDELSELPPRLLEIVKMIVMGEPNKVIALNQNITENAVKSQIKRLYAKLDVSTRTEFMAKYATALRNME